MLDLNAATDLAERYVIGLSHEAGFELVVLQDRTMERDFGWVFYYGPKDGSTLIAGNAPFIVDRDSGSVHVTATAYPTETYLKNYARTGRAFPSGSPDHAVVIEGWTQGGPVIARIPLTKAIRAATGYGLAEAKAGTDAVLSGRDVVLMFSTNAEADAFCERIRMLEAAVRREIR
jgi:hypothetical protein